jgi:hypothetical protein
VPGRIEKRAETHFLFWIVLCARHDVLSGAQRKL